MDRWATEFFKTAGHDAGEAWDHARLADAIGEHMVDYKSVHRGRVTPKEFTESFINIHDIPAKHRPLARQMMKEELEHQAKAFGPIPKSPAASAEFLFGHKKTAEAWATEFFKTAMLPAAPEKPPELHEVVSSTVGPPQSRFGRALLPLAGMGAGLAAGSFVGKEIFDSMPGNEAGLIDAMQRAGETVEQVGDHAYTGARVL